MENEAKATELLSSTTSPQLQSPTIPHPQSPNTPLPICISFSHCRQADPPTVRCAAGIGPSIASCGAGIRVVPRRG